MLVNLKVTGGLNIEWGQIDPKVTGGLRYLKTWGAIRGLSVLLKDASTRAGVEPPTL